MNEIQKEAANEIDTILTAQSLPDDSTGITDMLAAIRHWCEVRDEDFDDLVLESLGKYNMERSVAYSTGVGFIDDQCRVLSAEGVN
jgi:hypothetical protein